MNTHLTDGIGELNKKLELPERKKQSDSEMEAARLEIKSLQEKLDDTISQLKRKVDAIFSFLDFTAKEVAFLLGTKVSTIHSARSDLRKKLQMKEKGGNIRSFFVDTLF